MPVSNKNLARWYREISQHLAAGAGLAKALEVSGGVSRRDRQRLSKRLLAGEPVRVVLLEAPGWLPEIDRHALVAAAESGYLVETLTVLANQRTTAGRYSNRALGAAVYPLFLVHFALLALPLHVWFTSGLEAYLRQVLPILLPLWGVLLVLGWAIVFRHRWLSFLIGLLPILRGYRKSRDVAGLSFALSAYLVAGEKVSVAWSGAGSAVENGRFRRFAKRISVEAERGVPPGELLGKSRIFPEDFVSLYLTGERTGRLVENLGHLWETYSERASAKLRSAGFWYMKLLFLLVAAWIGYLVISAYVGRVEQMLEILN